MNIDLYTIIGNISRSFLSLEVLVRGFAYILAIFFFVTALTKLKRHFAAGHGSQEKIIIPFAFIIGGTMLLYLPSALDIAISTTFGVGNVLSYASYKPYDVMNSITIFLQLAGLIWFVRGCVLIVNSTQPGFEHGAKGVVFVCAGILALNFQGTTNFLTDMINALLNSTMNYKVS